MKTYRITMPPKHAGIYLLKNPTTKAFYVGQSVSLYRRFCEWRGYFQGGYGMRSSAVYEAVKASNLEDWEFVILKETPGATAQQLQSAEAAAIKAFDARGVPLLNHQPVLGGNPGRAMARSSTTITREGKPITYLQAAEILGCSTKTVAKRAARYRGKGAAEITIEDWMSATAKYRA